MRYREFALESYELDEEISLGKYTPKFKTAILDALTDALKNIKRNYLEKWGVWEEEKEAYKSGKTESLDKKIKDMLTEGALKSIQYMEVIGKDIQPLLKSVGFGKKSGAAAYATTDNKIFMRKDYYEQIADKLYDLIRETVMKNYKRYEQESLFNGLIITIDDAIETNCREFLNNNKLNSYIIFQAEAFVHELVHIVQNVRREKSRAGHRSGYNPYNFRSYLEKSSGDYALFHSLNGANALTPEEQEEYKYLYYALPEEMTAHAHNIALNMAHKYQLEKTGSNKKSYIIKANNALQNITSFIDSYRNLGKMYKNNTDPKAQAVYKRYQKFAYKELYDLIQGYIKKANFKA